MYNYIVADLSRIFYKKSMYLFFGSVLIGYIIMFLMQSGMTAARISSESNTIFLLASLFGGGYIFATLYTDDLVSKTLPALIGFGFRRTTIIFAKILTYFFLLALMFCGIFGLFYLTFLVYGFSLDSEILHEILIAGITNFLQTFAYGIVTSVIVYGTEKSSFSIVVFVLLVTTFISTLAGQLLGSNMVKNIFGELDHVLIVSIVGTLIDAPTPMSFVFYLIYIAIFVMISIFAFSKKELEF